MTEATREDRDTRQPRRVYWILVAITVGVVAAMAGAATAGFGRHGGMGWHHGGGHHGDPEVMRERMSFALEFGLRKLDATEDQQAAIEAIADRTFDSLMARHAEREQIHDTIQTLIASDEIDRDAIEALRASQIAALDAASQEVVAAAADALEVLTPAQRQQLVEHFESRHRRRE